MEPGTGTINVALPPRCPGVAAIIGKTLSDSVEGARQHPKRAVFLFNDHIFVETAMGNVGMSSQTNSFSFVRRSIYVGKLFCLQAVALCGNAAAGIAPDGGWKQPFPFGCYQRFVHHDPVSDAARRRPSQVFGVGILAQRHPYAAAAVVETPGLCPSHPKNLMRVDP